MAWPFCFCFLLYILRNGHGNVLISAANPVGRQLLEFIVVDGISPPAPDLL